MQRKLKIGGKNFLYVKVPNAIGRTHNSHSIMVLNVQDTFIDRKPDYKLIFSDHFVRTKIL